MTMPHGTEVAQRQLQTRFASNLKAPHHTIITKRESGGAFQRDRLRGKNGAFRSLRVAIELPVLAHECLDVALANWKRLTTSPAQLGGAVDQKRRELFHLVLGRERLIRIISANTISDPEEDQCDAGHDRVLLSNQILPLKDRIPHQVAGDRRVVSTSPEES